MEKTYKQGFPPNFESSEQLKALTEPTKNLENKDYSDLSKTLLSKGEFRLLNGDRSGLNYFDMALKLDPSNPKLYIAQGLSLFELGIREGNSSDVSLASKRFKYATTLTPQSFKAWHLWGNALYFLGKKKKDSNYFLNALKKYEKANSLKEGQPQDVISDLYQNIGDLWVKLGEISEEATDYLTAIKAYKQAASIQDDLPQSFWLNFGVTYFVLGNKTNNVKFFFKAISCYNSVISANPSSKESWYHLAQTLSELYYHTHDEDHFSQANDCYLTASKLYESPKNIYLSWAKLLFESGSIFSDVKKLKLCIQKCVSADKYDKNDFRTSCLWAEALAQLGVLTDNLEILHEAQNKIDSIIEQHENSASLYSCGIVLSALGSYYKESDYYYQAIELFQEGLSLDRSQYKLWHSMARSAFAAALLDEDEKSYERSNHFFERALSLKTTSTLHYHYASFLSKYAEFVQDEDLLKKSIYHFEQATNKQNNIFYVHLDWIFDHALALDQLSHYTESESQYNRALDLLNHILAINPNFPRIHYQLATVYSHYAELTGQLEIFYRSMHHYRVANQKEKENDQIILDWALVLLNLSEHIENSFEYSQHLRDAEYKMIQSAKLGNVYAYYFLACLYSLNNDLDNSLRFLEKAKKFDGLPSLDEIVEEEWLENIRETQKFQSFLARLESNIIE